MREIADDACHVLQQVREQMQTEIEKYKHETEEAVARTIAEMKAALEARLKEKIQLESEKDRLEALVAQLQGQVNELQAQVLYLNYTVGSSVLVDRISRARWPSTVNCRSVRLRRKMFVTLTFEPMTTKTFSLLLIAVILCMMNSAFRSISSAAVLSLTIIDNAVCASVTIDDCVEMTKQTLLCRVMTSHFIKVLTLNFRGQRQHGSRVFVLSSEEAYSPSSAEASSCVLLSCLPVIKLSRSADT